MNVDRASRIGSFTPISRISLLHWTLILSSRFGVAREGKLLFLSRAADAAESIELFARGMTGVEERNIFTGHGKEGAAFVEGATPMRRGRMRARR